MEYLIIGIILIIGYLLGSLNSSLIVGKAYGIDVRKHGSGNAGATNTLRTLGKKAAIFTSLGDILKGVIACIIGKVIFIENPELGAIIGGVGAILGHTWPLYFGFKGGKGVLTSISVILTIDYKIGLILCIIFIVLALLTKYVSLSSIVGAIFYPILVITYGNNSKQLLIFSIAISSLVIIRHRTNIVRLCKGTENKFGSKKNEQKN